MALAKPLGFSIALLIVSAISAAGQIVPAEPDPAAARIRLGPLSLNPTIGLTNVGVDTNVYYEDEPLTPERDVTMTVTGQSDYFMRMGRTWVVGNVREDLVWYKEFESERSINGVYDLTWLAPLNRLGFMVAGNAVNARERPGFEIDARSDRQERSGRGGVELRAFSKTYVGVRAERRTIEFDQGEEFLGRSLERELNRTITSTSFVVSHRLTPLTSVSLDVAEAHDRFQFSPNRDSDSRAISGGISFSRAALINGFAQFGYRRFTPLDQDVPGYEGATASVNLSHVARGSTRLGLQLLRDVQYSFEIQQPYYLQTGFTATVAQQIFGPVDVEMRATRYSLAYRERGATDLTTRLERVDRVDRITAYGGGVGYRIGNDLRIGFNIDRQQRKSDVPLRPYEGLRYGFAVTYGS
jgi:hypothetical protein